MNTNIADFIYELGSARRIKRSHIQFIGTSDDSIADHTFRVVVIALIIAEIEKVDIAKTLQMALIHDLAEIRTGDLNPINVINSKPDERAAFEEQVKKLPNKKALIEILEEYRKQSTKEAIVVKDADLLEQIALQREYSERGVRALEEWHAYQLKKIKLKSSKDIAQQLLRRSSFDWLHDITLNDKNGTQN